MFVKVISMEISEEINLKKHLPKAVELKNFASFFYAFSDDTRLKIIILLTLKPLCVGDIAMVMETNQTTISHQLKILKALNIVESARTGKNIVYYIRHEGIEQVLNAGAECI